MGSPNSLYHFLLGLQQADLCFTLSSYRHAKSVILLTGQRLKTGTEVSYYPRLGDKTTRLVECLW